VSEWEQTFYFPEHIQKQSFNRDQKYSKITTINYDTNHRHKYEECVANVRDRNWSLKKFLSLTVFFYISSLCNNIIFFFALIVPQTCTSLSISFSFPRFVIFHSPIIQSQNNQSRLVKQKTLICAAHSIDSSHIQTVCTTHQLASILFIFLFFFEL
jgi:hypothetical protein